MLEEKIILTDNGKRVLVYMQNHDVLLVGKDIGEETGIRGIYPTLHSLVNRGLVEKGEAEVRDFTNNKGETKPKNYQTYRLTEKGRNHVVNL